MAERHLIDTSSVIKYLNGSFSNNSLDALDKIIDQESQISFITEIELQVWNPANPEDASVYREFIVSSNVIGINSDIISETIRIRKQYRIKLPDALIAATAIVNNLILVADNDKDYKKVLGLKYLNPAKISN